MFVVFAYLLAISGLAIAKVYDGACPTVFPKTSDISKVPSLSVHYYLPVESNVNHLFYPKDENDLVMVMVDVDIEDNNRHMHLNKYFGPSELCYTEIVSKVGNETDSFMQHELVISGVPKLVKECGPHWDMYQFFRIEDLYILWGCVNLSSKKKTFEQGLWVLGKVNSRSSLTEKLIQAINFTQIHVKDLILLIMPAFKHADEANACGNFCKYPIKFEALLLIFAFLAVLIACPFCIVKLNLFRNGNKIHQLVV